MGSVVNGLRRSERIRKPSTINDCYPLVSIRETHRKESSNDTQPVSRKRKIAVGSDKDNVQRYESINVLPKTNSTGVQESTTVKKSLKATKETTTPVSSNTVRVGEDGLDRCWWCASDELYRSYHDNEWGIPVHSDNRLFESLCLEGAQAGLSFLTILKKRENYRKIFLGFDMQALSALCEDDKFHNTAMENDGIVRHRGKILSVTSNARLALDIVREYGSMDAYFWGYVNGRTIIERNGSIGSPSADESVKVSESKIAIVVHREKGAAMEIGKSMSKDLKKRGFKFVGPTICHAFMQAVGMVNDHHPKCHRFTSVNSKI
eukprot:CFRG5132T1